MNKKNIALLIAGIVLAAIIAVLIFLFTSKKTVSFDSVGGSSVPSQEVRFFSKASKPQDPTRDGYTFDSWYLDDKKFDFDSRITKDTKLVARWSAAESSATKFTVKFSTGEGSDVDPIEVDENGTISKPQDPTRDGYTFVSWQYNGKDFDFDSKVTKNMTLTAKWQKNDDSKTAASTSGSNKKPSSSKPSSSGNSGNSGNSGSQAQQPESQDPTPQEPENNDSYVVTLTKLQQSFGGAVLQYEITSVTNNGNKAEFKNFSYNGGTYWSDQLTMLAKSVDEKVTSAKITLSDGKVVDAVVKYAVREV